jgi:processive 1,2-diacylglycerol beta-glucosyltransferase
MKKVMILYSTGGMGHKKAAKALFEAFKDKGGDLEVKNVDTLEFGDKMYRFLYDDAYVYLMTKGKTIWGLLYKFSDLKPVGRIMKKVREHLDIKSLKGLDEMIVKEDPDVIVTTHFILPAIAGVLKKQNVRAKMYVSITDYGPHSFWMSDDIDKYFVGAESMVEDLKGRGVPDNKISVTGIPVVKDFSEKFDKKALREKYGLDPERKTIFMLSGGFGVGPMEEMLEELGKCNAKIQVITVCGHNKNAYENIDTSRKNLNYPVVLFGFTDKIAELMAVSDLMITKAGGISVSEAMAMDLPMILFASIPGQETWNENMLTAAGAAVKAKSVDELSGIADRILLSVDEYEHMKEGLSKVGKPFAARDIVEEVMREM